MKRRASVLEIFVAYAAFGLLLAIGGVIGAHEPGTPPHRFDVRPATPEESLRHQIKRAFEIDAALGLPSGSVPPA